MTRIAVLPLHVFEPHAKINVWFVLADVLAIRNIRENPGERASAQPVDNSVTHRLQ